jgi:hypothetical protein
MIKELKLLTMLIKYILKKFVIIKRYIENFIALHNFLEDLLNVLINKNKKNNLIKWKK